MSSKNATFEKMAVQMHMTACLLDGCTPEGVWDMFHWDDRTKGIRSILSGETTASQDILIENILQTLGTQARVCPTGLAHHNKQILQAVGDIVQNSERPTPVYSNVQPERPNEPPTRVTCACIEYLDDLKESGLLQCTEPDCLAPGRRNQHTPTNLIEQIWNLLGKPTNTKDEHKQIAQTLNKYFGIPPCRLESTSHNKQMLWEFLVAQRHQDNLNQPENLTTQTHFKTTKPPTADPDPEKVSAILEKLGSQRPFSWTQTPLERLQRLIQKYNKDFDETAKKNRLTEDCIQKVLGILRVQDCADAEHNKRRLQYVLKDPHFEYHLRKEALLVRLPCDKIPGVTFTPTQTMMAHYRMG